MQCLVWLASLRFVNISCCCKEYPFVKLPLLTRLVPPTIFPFDFGEESVDTGTMATINCAVTKGDTPISISWLFNGEPVQSGYDSVMVTKSGQRISMLAIESVRPEHSGIFTCIARNRAGEMQHSSELKVIGIEISNLYVYLPFPLP